MSSKEQPLNGRVDPLAEGLRGVIREAMSGMRDDLKRDMQLMVDEADERNKVRHKELREELRSDMNEWADQFETRFENKFDIAGMSKKLDKLQDDVRDLKGKR
ncbi:MAG: hypothetical protein MPK06_08540 [Alphaproteobacteria bacterium]|nr:hypothetical protein [Alphaproteobacteria bacterium]MDA7983271.1 hypothetical protein [Alphaproteobacteria bacterium]MDA7988897.1 hypothetical protein [Alphaproteobacteria bacterium]MDA8001635.1 hypothetical protein [Alphaproteobacteria bacterium]MDA8004533.1 hypothetical protein [Alphaproteobacteria bacterium]